MKKFSKLFIQGRLLLALLITCCWLLFPIHELGAVHIIGGEMTYECLGASPGIPNSQRYLITMIVYRDCALDGSSQQGGSFDSDANADPNRTAIGTVSVYRGSATTEFTNVILSQPVITVVEPDIGNPCLVIPPSVCVQQGIYTFTLDLPISTERYTITYQRCCRNPTITNILMPASVGATYFIHITPEAQAVCNNSPVFDNFPPIVLCVNEYFELPMAATDADGDRLVYYLCSPVEGGGNVQGQIAPDPDAPPPYDPVSFNAPNFTAQRPLGQDANFTYNDTTGLLSGTPTIQGQFVVGICIDEFRGDTLLSSTKREFQFNVTFCAQTVNADLQEDSVTPDGRFLIDICGSGAFTIVNESTQEQFIDTYSWYLSDITSSDTLRGSSRNFNLDLAVGTYEGVMILNEIGAFDNCKDTALFFINVYPDLRADFSYEYDTCVADIVTFTDLSVADDPGGIRSWAWNFADGSPLSNSQNPLHRYSSPGDFPVNLTITDFNRCSNTATINLPYFPAPPILIVAPSEAISCAPATILLNNLSVPIDDTYDIEWEFGDGGRSGEISPTYTYEEIGTYDVYLGVTSPIGCFIDTLFRRLVTVLPSPTAGFDFNPESPNNLEPTVDFFDRSRDAVAWRYEIGDFFGTNQQNFTYEFRDTGLIEVRQIVTHPSGCMDTLLRLIDVEPVITFHVPNAFTPNGDGLNDVFIPKAILFGYKAYQFSVWDRWGQRIFTTEEPNEGWDGRFNGLDSPGGGYLWEASIIDARNRLQKYKGSVVLLR